MDNDITKIMSSFKQQGKFEAMTQHFPGASCGIKECEETAAETCHVAEMLSVDPRKLIGASIENSITPKYGCVRHNTMPNSGAYTEQCRFGYVRPNIKAFSDKAEVKYIFHAETQGCKKCMVLDGVVVTEDDMKDEAKMKGLGFSKQEDGTYKPHPHCKCTWEMATLESKDELSLQKIKDLIDALVYVWNNKIPKPPRMTDHEGKWLELVWMWFFEQGPNPIRFDKNSAYSRDIAKSYSMKVVKEKYKKSGKIPSGWDFHGHETAKYVLGEVEWFVGGYSIQNFKNQNGLVSFTVYNVSSWHSGTRLPPSWIEFLENKTGYKIVDLVSSAPRGQTLKSKIRAMIPASLLQNPVSGRIIQSLLNKLPSFGGDWEQYFEVEVRWDD